MKKIHFLLLAALVIFSISCSTNLVYINVTQPAPVSLPGYIKKIGIVNRSIPDPNNKVNNKIDEILSVKDANLDMDGAKESIRGLYDALNQNQRFTEIVNLANVRFKGTTPGLFPSPLSWEDIETTCKNNNLDALFVLELFYTSSKINYSTQPKTINTPLGSVTTIEHIATIHTNVKAGWRIYDPKNRSIIDEFPQSKTLTFTGKGINPVTAASALLDRKEAVKQCGYAVAQQYSERILPYFEKVTRDYYVKGSPNLVIATRNAQIGKWDEATLLWQKDVNNPNPKIMARACYNMAISNEINGNIDDAIEWAQKAYVIGNQRFALDYVNQLKYRKTQVNRLEEQKEAAQQ